MRRYKQTHPWINFSSEFLEKADQKFWFLLGECQSKCRHILDAPILPENHEALLMLYLTKGVMATTAIEGNTLSEEEVRARLEGRSQLPPSREYLGQEIDNVTDGCNAILDFVARGKQAPPLSVGEIQTFNRFVLRDLALEEGVVPGEIRTYSVGVPGYRGAPAEDCEFLLERLCEWLNSTKGPEGMEAAYAIIKAVVAHVYLAWIHPFGDGNGRTARLLEFRILITSGVPHPAAHLLSNHYNQTRNEYYRQLNRASKSGGDLLPFLNYAVQGLRDGLVEQIDVIQNQQWDVVWRDFVFKAFRGKKPSETVERQKKLALALTNETEYVQTKNIPTLTTALALAYDKRTPKTLTRDINTLENIGLIVKKGRKVRARREAIWGFRSIVAILDE